MDSQSLLDNDPPAAAAAAASVDEEATTTGLLAGIAPVTAVSELQEQLTEPLLVEEHHHHPPTSAAAASVANDGDDDSGNDNDESPPSFAGLFFFRFLYFLNGLSASTWGRFGIIFYNQVAELSPFQIGILQGVTPLLSFLAMPVWGIIADWIHSQKKVYLFTKIANSCALLSLPLVTYLVKKSNNEDDDDDDDNRHKHSNRILFRWIVLCVSIMSLFRASGVLDAYVLDYLGSAHRGMYGTIRLWTAVSWGLGAMIMGSITDRFGFEWNFVLYAAMMVVMLLVVACGLPARSKKEQERYEWNNNTANNDTITDSSSNDPRRRRPDVRVLWKAITRVPVIFWLMEVIIVGSGVAVVESFLFVYLQNDLHASTKLCGATVGVTVLLELPIFHYSKSLLHRIGHDGLFVIAMIAYVTRVFGYTCLTKSTVHWVLPLEILHGITFACMWIASIDFSAAAAPEEWSTAFQTILSASFACFGSVLGAMGGGWIMEQYSAIIMYRGMGCLVGGVLFLHLVQWLVFGQGHDSFLTLLHQQNADNDDEDEARNDGDGNAGSYLCIENDGEMHLNNTNAVGVETDEGAA